MFWFCPVLCCTICPVCACVCMCMAVTRNSWGGDGARWIQTLSLNNGYWNQLSYPSLSAHSGAIIAATLGDSSPSI